MSCVSFHFFSIWSFQKSFRRVRALPHMKFSVCHFSSVWSISCGEPRPCRMVMTLGTGFSFRNLMYLRTSLQSSRNSPGLARLISLVPRTAIAFTPFEPMTAPMPSRLALDLPCSIDAVNTLFSPARPIAATWAIGSFSSLRINSCVSTAPLPARWAASRISILSLFIQM